jgi:hypothetical protein
MKIILASLAFLLFSSAYAFDCAQNEAQFIGKVSDVRVVKIDQGIRDCYFKIQFTRFDSSALCPMDNAQASNTEFLDSDCQQNLENGKEISGYLIQRDGSIFLD